MLWWWKSPCTSVVRPTSATRRAPRSRRRARSLGLRRAARTWSPIQRNGARGRPPELEPDRRPRSRRLRVGQPADVARAGALDQQRPSRRVAAEEPHRAVAGPVLERVGLLVGLVVLAATFRTAPSPAGATRVARERERLARGRLPTPPRPPGDRLERGEVRPTSLSSAFRRPSPCPGRRRRTSSRGRSCRRARRGR